MAHFIKNKDGSKVIANAFTNYNINEMAKEAIKPKPLTTTNNRPGKIRKNNTQQKRKVVDGGQGRESKKSRPLASSKPVKKADSNSLSWTRFEAKTPELTGNFDTNINIDGSFHLPFLKWEKSTNHIKASGTATFVERKEDVTITSTDVTLGGNVNEVLSLASSCVAITVNFSEIAKNLSACILGAMKAIYSNFDLNILQKMDDPNIGIRNLLSIVIILAGVLPLCSFMAYACWMHLL